MKEPNKNGNVYLVPIKHYRFYLLKAKYNICASLLITAWICCNYFSNFIKTHISCHFKRTNLDVSTMIIVFKVVLKLTFIIDYIFVIQNFSDVFCYNSWFCGECN